MNEPLFIQETLVNQDRREILMELDIVETRFTRIGELFSFLQKQYGRYISKIYVGEVQVKQKGWVFEKLETDFDGNDYIQEVWVSVHTALPTITTHYHYYEGFPSCPKH